MIKKLSIILAESALELIPGENIFAQKVHSKLKKGKKILFSDLILDVSNHQNIIRKLKIHEKRGRPDIIHTTLLFILGSPLNIEGYVETYIHTINDYVIWVNPETRIPKNYNRFKGLMGKLFIEKKISSDSTTLLNLTKKSISSLIADMNCDKVFILTEKGSYMNAIDFARVIEQIDNPCVIIGGFPHGDFSSKVYNLNAVHISLYKKSLYTWVVAAKIVSSIENVLSL